MVSNRKIILFIALLVTISITAYVLLVTIPSRLAEKSYEGARKIGKDIREAFQFTPEIIVNNTVVLQQQTPVLELAVLSQEFMHQYDWINTWMGSTKKIKVTGTFSAKAGFDLNEQFTINIEKDKAIVFLPEPKILSIESLGDIKFEDEHGIWNWVNQADRIMAINAFTLHAKAYAGQANFIQDAKQEMEKKMKEILHQHVREVEIHFQSINKEENTIQNR